MAAFATEGILSAQGPVPNSLSSLQQSVAQRTTEWNTLAANLERRVARLLPCDPQARAAIEEVGRASDARTVALASYWIMASIQSKTQVEAIRGLLAQEERRAGEWTADVNQVRAGVAFATAQGTSLASSVQQLPAMANPEKDLEAIGEDYRLLEKQAQERADGGGRLLEGLRELLRISQVRQAAIDDRLKTASAEGQRWRTYYAARQARAQIECSLVNPAADSGPASVPRATPQGKKQ